MPSHHWPLWSSVAGPLSAVTCRIKSPPGTILFFVSVTRRGRMSPIRKLGSHVVALDGASLVVSAGRAAFINVFGLPALRSDKRASRKQGAGATTGRAHGARFGHVR